MSKAIGATGDESLKAEIGRNGLKRTGAPFRHPENADHEMSGNTLGTLLCRVIERSTREVENLILMAVAVAIIAITYANMLF